MGSIFPHYMVSHIPKTMSNHCPIALDIGFGFGQANGRQFRFRVVWLLEDSCEVEVLRLWKDANGNVLQKLSHVSSGLVRWFRRVRRGKRSSLASLQEWLE